jgi:hypothetical protein
MRTVNRVLAAVSGTILAAILLACGSGPTTHRKATPDLQAKRLKIVNDAISLGVLDKVESGGVPKVWVGPAFRALSFEEKNAIIGAAYAYLLVVDPSDPPRAADTPDPQVLIVDRNGKVIGRYGPTFGGLEMD